MDPQAPPVVAVVVAADPGPWLEETLASLAAQDYPNLSVLVIDAASAADPTPRVAAVLPGAYVRRLGTPVGYGAACNEALQVVEGAAFFLFCHDDVAPDPDAVRQLVEEAYRSNAGVVAPKLVDWDDPRRLLQVGMGADKGGVPVPLVTPGELDHEQHDAVRDVFVAPGGAVLVRADLFAALGGFDPGIAFYGESLDLSWRAQIAGARVVVAPGARVRHVAAAARGLRPLPPVPGVPAGPDAGEALRRRHELRSALKAYGPWHLLRVAPQLVVHTLVEVVAALVAGRRSEARAALGAWAWNLARLGELRRLRREVRRSRTLPDREIRPLQSSTTARMLATVESAFTRAAARSPFHFELNEPPPEPSPVPDVVPGTRLALGPARPWLPAALWAGVVVVLVVGSRNLFHGGLPAVGSVPLFPRASDLLGRFASGWRDTGLGQSTPAPLGFALLGAAGSVLFGSMGLLRNILTIGMLPIGALGAYRLSRPLDSVRGRLVATLVYLALPLPYSSLAHGRWGPLIAYGAAPWLLSRLAAATGLAPFGPGGAAGAGPAPLPLWRRWVGLGVLLALAGALEPGVVVAAVLAGVGLVVGSAVAGGAGRAVGALTAAVAGSVVALALAFPWSIDLIAPGARAGAVLGVPEMVPRATGLGSLLGFQGLWQGASWGGWVLLGAAALPLLFGRDWRLTWAVRLWWVALVMWGVAWAGGRGWFGVPVPDAGVLLAVAGAAVALAAGLGAVAFEIDLVGYGLGWRQAAAVAAGVGVVAGVLGVLGAAVNGRWGAASAGFDVVTAPLGGGPRAAGGFRMLWAGDPYAVPAPGWQLQDGAAYSLSLDGFPDAAAWWPGADPGAARLAADAVLLAERGRTAQLGHLLAPMGVRYLTVPLRTTPTGQRGLDAPPPSGLLDALDVQMDLRRVEVDPALVVYENAAWAPTRAALSPGAAAAARSGGMLVSSSAADLSTARPVLTSRSGASSFAGVAPAGPVLWSAPPHRWRLTTAGGTVAGTPAFGWATMFDVPAGGSARLEYAPGPGLPAAIAGETLLWVLAVGALTVSGRRRRRRDRQERRSAAAPAGPDVERAGIDVVPFADRGVRA